jgi:PTH1 family peptidyl-tRNA hydrolase
MYLHERLLGEGGPEDALEPGRCEEKYTWFGPDVNSSRLEMRRLLSSIASVKTKIIAGLGNPGSEYEETRHNVGYMAIDVLAHSFRIRKFHRERLMHWAEADVVLCTDGEPVKVVLVRPQTFMNTSGIAVGRLLAKYSAPLEDLIVIHDEMDLPVGLLRVSFDASSAGHRGVHSIAATCGGNGFTRVRIGIQKPSERGDVIDYVLSKFNRSELKDVQEALFKTPDVVRSIICDGVMTAQSLFNRKAPPS